MPGWWSTSGTSKIPNDGVPAAKKSKHLPAATEVEILAEVIDKSGAFYSKSTQKMASNNQQNGGTAMSTGLSSTDVASVLNDLMVAAGEAGMYGLLFKIITLIKQRVDKAKEVDGKAESLKKLSDHILTCFDNMKTRFASGSNNSVDDHKNMFTMLEEEAVLLFAECARVLGRITSKASNEKHAGHTIWIDKMARGVKRLVTAPGYLQDLDTCISKLQEFVSTMTLEDQARTVNDDLPYLGEKPYVGTKFGQSIRELTEFVSASKHGAEISVVHITGPPGAGKSRLAKEIIHAVYSKQADIDRAAGRNDVKIELLQIDCSNVSGSHLEPVECQRKLLEQIADSRAAEGLSHKDVGITKIQNALRSWKYTSSVFHRRKIVMFFDNAPTQTSLLIEILPFDISELLPPGSCVLLSMRGYDSDWTSNGVYERIQRLFPSPTCRHKVHEGQRLGSVESRSLFQQHAGGVPPGWSDIIDDLIERCEGNPKLLVLFGKFWASQRTRTPSFWKDILRMLEDMDASSLNEASLDGLWKEHTSKAVDEAAAERRRMYARFNAKVGLAYTMKLEECQDAVSDICNLFDGWSWNTVEAVLGIPLMKELKNKKFVSSEFVFENLYKDLVRGGYQIYNSSDLAALMNKCGRRSQRLLKVVHAKPEFTDTARYINRDKHLRAVNTPMPKQLSGLRKGEKQNLRSLCLLNCEGKFELRWLDRIQGLHYLILHNIEKTRGVITKAQNDLRFLYWGSMSTVRFPFAAENLPNLQTLVLTDVDFSSQPRIGIPSLLQNLSLIRCRNIHLVATDIFRLVGLRSLHLQECEGDCEFQLADGVQPKVPLSLSFQKCPDMERIPTFIHKLQCLTDLGFISCPNLKGRELESVGKQQSERYISSSLRSVSFEDCRSLTCFPVELALYSKCLTELEIKSCRVQEISPLIAQFQNLKKLTVASCPPLRTLPPEIGALPLLHTLSLEENRGLTSLPPEIGKLQLLYELKLDYCQSLQSVPLELKNLRRLRILSTSFCYGLHPNADPAVLPDLDERPNLRYVKTVGSAPLLHKLDSGINSMLTESSFFPTLGSSYPSPRLVRERFTFPNFLSFLFDLFSKLLFSLSIFVFFSLELLWRLSTYAVKFPSLLEKEEKQRENDNEATRRGPEGRERKLEEAAAILGKEARRRIKGHREGKSQMAAIPSDVESRGAKSQMATIPFDVESRGAKSQMGPIPRDVERRESKSEAGAARRW